MKIILDYNRTIFNPDTNALYPGALELLEKLSAKHELFLISRHEPTRKKKLEKLNIKKYFQKIIFVDNKSKQIFATIADDTKNIMVIGDSIKDEIKIGNQLGFITIRLKKGKFALEIPQEKDENADFEIIDIKHLENVVLKYEK